MTPKEKYEADIAAATYGLVYFVISFPLVLALENVSVWAAAAALTVGAIGTLASCYVREWVRIK